jgi:hypothetical protein
MGRQFGIQPVHGYNRQQFRGHLDSHGMNAGR